MLSIKHHGAGEQRRYPVLVHELCHRFSTVCVDQIGALISGAEICALEGFPFD